MRILYIHQYFKFPEDGTATRIYDLATSFVKCHHKVIILASTSNLELKGKKRWHVVNKEGLEIHYVYLRYDNKFSYWRRSLMFLKFLYFASSRVLQIESDVVLATSTPLTIGIPAILKKWFGGTPYIFEVRDVWPEAVIAIGAVKNKLLQKILYYLEGLIYKNAAAIVPLSVDMQKSIIDRYPKYANKTKVVIPNISELNRFKNTDGVIDLKEIIGFTPRFSILYAGTFGKVNGIDYAINLAEKTLKIDAKLVYIFIGRGAEKEAVIQLAKDKKVLNKNVFILEPVTKDDLSAWYNAVSMGSSFVIDIKELWANSANKFFDTLAASRPILINHRGWQANIIEKENIGYVLPAKLTDFEIERFVAYTKEVKLHKEQSENALHVAKTNYSLDIAVEKYQKILQSIK